MKDKKVIFITGASSGFGKETAGELVRRGHIVYGTSRKGVACDNGVRMLPMDVTDKDSIAVAVDRVVAEQGRIDVLINNAGVGISGALELATEEEFEWQMGTNFKGMVNMCNAVLPHMRNARNGRIINISSIAGVMAVPFQGFYSASKFAIEGYSEALSMEVHPFGIKVCVVEPGDFCTNFTANRNVSKATLDCDDYRECFERTMGIIEKEELGGSKPIKLAKRIARLVERRNPPFRTKVGPWFQVALAKVRWVVPQSWLAKGLRWFYKIG